VSVSSLLVGLRNGQAIADVRGPSLMARCSVINKGVVSFESHRHWRRVWARHTRPGCDRVCWNTNHSDQF
jgi:hypothetical protein